MKITKDPTYETERLIIRPTTIADAAFVYEVMNTEGWLKYIGDRGIKTEEDDKNYILEKIRPQQERLGFSNHTVIRKSDGVKIGSCGLYDREGLEGVDIGFAFLPQYGKKGYAFEAATTIKSLALNEFGLTQINAITTPANIKSQKLLEKLGLQFVKIIHLPNDPADLMFYQLFV
ncbi:MAG: GNAT family N-acetyltransferase [Saprospiraceae bacterium]